MKNEPSKLKSHTHLELPVDGLQNDKYPKL